MCSQVRIKPSLPLAMLQDVVNCFNVSTEKKLRELREQIEVRKSELRLLEGWELQLQQRQVPGAIFLL